jgi:poly(3-hydroxybutyrate) depolymerase
MLLTAVALLNPAFAVAAVKKLPALGADATKVSISGLSSGAYMAVQYGVAFSSSTVGVGVVAGGPYNCAYVNIGGVITCMSGAPIGLWSYEAALGFAFLGQIDSVDYLAPQKIYLFSGTSDPIVKQSVMDAVWDFYTAAHVPAANIRYIKQLPAGHAFISDDFGGSCGSTAAPYVNECTSGGVLYDQPNAILTQIYGPLHPKAATLSATPMAFRQTEFASSLTGMAKTGYVYIPAACQRGGGTKCAVHVVFHGCTQSAAEVGDAVYGRLGYNEWADSNGIVVLYPQVNTSVIPYNPKGCWDWWGYSGLNFQTQGGPQLSAVRAMVKRLTKP